MALEDSGDPDIDPSREGVLIATGGAGGLATIETRCGVYLSEGP
jgi:hypothetical protein